MRKYFISERITYCYPYQTCGVTKDYGVLSDYIGKYYNRDEIDKIICGLIMRHPYIEHSMFLKITVEYTDGNLTGFYHLLNFENYNDENQSKGSLEIKYEK